MSSAPRYCAYYCEENVWHLCAELLEHPEPGEVNALFISNPARRLAMWGQRISPHPERPIVWDYHVVILMRPTRGAWQVWDLDARRSGPQPAGDWLERAFPAAASACLPPELAPRFRCVSGADYRRYLRSDRRHMRAADGTPRAPPPSWPPIQGERWGLGDDDGHNLDRFVDTLDSSGFVGECMDLGELSRWLDGSLDRRGLGSVAR